MARADTIFGEAHLGPAARAGNVPFVLIILLYRVTLSPFIGKQCRFEPTCSLFGLGSYRRFGPVRGTWLTICRICRCHPFNKGGYDPVPLHPHDLAQQPLHCESGGSSGDQAGVQANDLTGYPSGDPSGDASGDEVQPGSARNGKREETPRTGRSNV